MTREPVTTKATRSPAPAATVRFYPNTFPSAGLARTV